MSEAERKERRLLLCGLSTTEMALEAGRKKKRQSPQSPRTDLANVFIVEGRRRRGKEEKEGRGRSRRKELGGGGCTTTKGDNTQRGGGSGARREQLRRGQSESGRRSDGTNAKGRRDESGVGHKRNRSSNRKPRTQRQRSRSGSRRRAASVADNPRHHPPPFAVMQQEEEEEERLPAEALNELRSIPEGSLISPDQLEGVQERRQQTEEKEATVAGAKTNGTFSITVTPLLLHLISLVRNAFF